MANLDACFCKSRFSTIVSLCFELLDIDRFSMLSVRAITMRKRTNSHSAF